MLARRSVNRVSNVRRAGLCMLARKHGSAGRAGQAVCVCLTCLDRSSGTASMKSNKNLLQERILQPVQERILLQEKDPTAREAPTTREEPTTREYPTTREDEDPSTSTKP